MGTELIKLQIKGDKKLIFSKGSGSFSLNMGLPNSKVKESKQSTFKIWNKTLKTDVK